MLQITMSERGRGLRKTDAEYVIVANAFRTGAYDASHYRDPAHSFKSETIRTSRPEWEEKFTRDAFRTSICKLLEALSLEQLTGGKFDEPNCMLSYFVVSFHFRKLLQGTT